jgi:hypothetical protein
MNRLLTLAPELVQRLQQATHAKQRAAALAASEFAIDAANVQNACIAELLNSLRQHGRTSEAQRQELETLKSDLDDEYFELKESAEQGKTTSHEYLRKFAQARAVSALLFACNDDPFEAATEAIYEAAAAFDNPQPLFKLIKSL